MTSGLSLRPARIEDVPVMRDLYNGYVESSPVTFDIEPRTLDDREEWFAQFSNSGPHQLIIAEVEGTLAGYAGTTAHRKKAAYARSVETTIYIDQAFQGQGIGRALYHRLFEILGGEDVHMIYSGITLPNDASLALHRAFGFSEIGTFHEVGYKFDRYWDVIWFEKKLS